MTKISLTAQEELADILNAGKTKIVVQTPIEERDVVVTIADERSSEFFTCRLRIPSRWIARAEVIMGENKRLRAPGKGKGRGDAIAKTEIGGMAIQLIHLPRPTFRLEVVAVEHIDRFSQMVGIVRRAAPLDAETEQIKGCDVGAVEKDVIRRQRHVAQHVGDRLIAQTGLLAKQRAEKPLGGVRRVQDQLFALQQQGESHKGRGQGFP